MSDFWARKVRTYFVKIDLNSDGFFSKKDAEEMADRYSDAEKSSQEQKQQLKRDVVELWGKYMKSAGPDDNGLLTPAIIVASIDQQRNDPEFKKTFTKTCLFAFSLLDVNGDGYLSEDEFARAFTDIGAQATSVVRAAFDYMDLNKDGKIDLAEYSSAFYKYLTTEDEHLLFGPLVD